MQTTTTSVQLPCTTMSPALMLWWLARARCTRCVWWWQGMIGRKERDKWCGGSDSGGKGVVGELLWRVCCEQTCDI